MAARYRPQNEQSEKKRAISVLEFLLMSARPSVDLRAALTVLGDVVTGLVGFARHAHNVQALDDAGWVPHYSMPFDCVAKCGGDTEAIHGLLSRYYQERWPEVRRDIESRLERYDIDNESKNMFCEALSAHEAGFYRSVCRSLILEIERVSRTELYGDEVKRITSQKELREWAGNNPAVLSRARWIVRPEALRKTVEASVRTHK